MLAARLHGIGDLRVGTEPEPGEPQPGWSLIRVTSVGICGSDLHWFADGGIGENRIEHPVVPGHEFAGVALTGPYAGRRVAVDPAIPCESCERCAAGDHNLCPTVEFAGHGTLDGALREYLVWPDRLLHPLPDELSDDAGALLEPLGVAIHAVDVSHLRPGADVAWSPAEGAEPVLDATDGRGVDVVIEVAGTDDAIGVAVAASRPGARIALAGIPSEDASSFPAAPARRKGLTFAMVRRMNDTYPRAIELARTGIDLDALVTESYGLTDAAKAFTAAAERRGDKVVIRCGRPGTSP